MKELKYRIKRQDKQYCIIFDTFFWRRLSFTAESIDELCKRLGMSIDYVYVLGIAVNIDALPCLHEIKRTIQAHNRNDHTQMDVLYKVQKEDRLLMIDGLLKRESDGFYLIDSGMHHDELTADTSDIHIDNLLAGQDFDSCLCVDPYEGNMSYSFKEEKTDCQYIKNGNLVVKDDFHLYL